MPCSEKVQRVRCEWFVVWPQGLNLIFAVLPVRRFFWEDQRQIKNKHSWRPPRLCGEKILLGNGSEWQLQGTIDERTNSH